MRGIEHIPWLYDATAALSDRFGFADWRDAVVAGATGRTLEIGCGTGRNLPRYAPAVRVIGSDPDLNLLRRARERAPAVPLVAARVEALPFPNDAFDTVVSSLVFCSVDDPARGLSEVRRVLAPNGELRMLEHVRSRSRLGARVQDLIQPMWTRFTGGCRPNRDTEATVEAAGFRIEPESRAERKDMRRFVARST